MTNRIVELQSSVKTNSRLLHTSADVYWELYCAGDNGYLGISKPVEYGGLGLDYSYEIAAAEAFTAINSGGVAMAIGVQCDMATPALTKYGSHHVKENFLRPTIAGKSKILLWMKNDRIFIFWMLNDQ